MASGLFFSQPGGGRGIATEWVWQGTQRRVVVLSGGMAFGARHGSATRHVGAGTPALAPMEGHRPIVPVAQRWALLEWLIP